MTEAATAWLNAWMDAFGLPVGLPEWFLAVVGIALSFCLVVIPSITVIAYLDRKLSADFQARVGPNRTGPRGIAQSLADLLKLLQKAGRKVEGATGREALWFAIYTMALYSTVALLPLGSLMLFFDTDMSVFLPFWAVIVLALGTMLLGLSQGSLPGYFGGMRVASQTLAGAFPALMALLCVGVKSGSFRWGALVASQGASPLHWTAFGNPFQFTAFVVFLVSGLVLLGIPPMDTGFAAPDIHGGVSSHLSGRWLILYRLGRLYGFFLWSVIAVVLFLGAWSLPFGVASQLMESENLRVLQLLELIWLLMKTFFLMLIVVWIARVNPRSRVDQITDFSWKVLGPFSLFALIGASLMAGWRAL